jgi:hypothetical protein
MPRELELKARGGSLTVTVPGPIKQIAGWDKDFVLLDEDGNELDGHRFFGSLQARAPDGTIHPGPYHPEFGKEGEEDE